MIIQLEKRNLTPEIVRYSFSDVFKKIDDTEREYLIEKVNEQLSILSARKLRRAITEVYAPYSTTITEYLSRKSNRDNINITLLLMIAEPRVVSKIKNLLNPIDESYSSPQISSALGIHRDLVTSKIFDFERSVKKNILYEDKNGNRLRLIVSRAVNSSKKIRISAESYNYLSHDDIERVVFDKADKDIAIENFPAAPGAFQIRDIVENWSPEIFITNNMELKNFIDIYIISKARIRKIRYYHDIETTVFIFDRPALSFPLPDP